MTNKFSTKNLVLMGLLTAVLLVMCYTPLGYLNIGVLAITLNTIPVAIAAYALGPVGGGVIGGVFGLTSFLQCFGISKMGTAIFAINPALTVFQCFVPRILDGLLIGFIANFLKKQKMPAPAGGAIVGFCAAFFNTLFYMTSLILLFGNSSYVHKLRSSVAPGRNVLVFVVLLVGVNALVEWFTTAVVTGAVSTALNKARLVDKPAQA